MPHLISARLIDLPYGKRTAAYRASTYDSSDHQGNTGIDKFTDKLMAFWKSLILSVAATAVLLPVAKSAQASTALPMTISTGEGMFSITVPDSNTTKSAYGGRLRVYDVHIAKMFEVTHWMCASRRLSPGTTWTYRADSGAVNMGDFQISCQLASDIAAAYGLGKAEATPVEISYEEAGREVRTWSVPILNITGGKIDSWMRFTRNFKPLR